MGAFAGLVNAGSVEDEEEEEEEEEAEEVR